MKLFTKTVALMPLFTALVTTAAVLSLCTGQRAYASSTVAAQDGSASPTVAGKWKLSFTDPTGKPKQGTLALQQDGSNLTGNYTGPRGTFSVKGTVQGNGITFTIKAMGRKLSFTGNVDGDKMSGTTQTDTSWNASRE